MPRSFPPPPPPPPPPMPRDEGLKEPEHIPAIKRMGYAEFRPPPAPMLPGDIFGSLHEFRPDQRQGHVLEVEVPDNDRRSGLISTDNSGPLNKRETPRRLRLRSRLLLQSLNEACNVELSVSSGKMVFIRPYKLFSVYEREIRQHHSTLEKRYGAFLDREEPATRSTRPLTQIDSDGSRTLEHFRLLIELFDEDLRSLFHTRQALREGNMSTISFDDLWHLFEPGQEIWAPGREGSEGKLYRVLRFTGGRELLQKRVGPPYNAIGFDMEPGNWTGSFGVQCWSLEYDESVYRPTTKSFAIRRYEGERDITTLPVFPTKFCRDTGFREDCQKYGQIFLQFSRGQKSHQRYLGPNLHPDARGEQINSEVIVDFQQAYVEEYGWPVRHRPDDFPPGFSPLRPAEPSNPTAVSNYINRLVAHDSRETGVDWGFNPRCREPGCCTYDVYHADHSIDDEREEEFFGNRVHSPLAPKNELCEESDYSLLPRHVYAYVLKTRRWAILSTSPDRLRDVDPQNAWEDLVLKPRIKTTVEALVKQHLARPDFDRIEKLDGSYGDLISGKGRGLVFLLHGPPGVGKTSTAECIALHMRKPLYSLTSGNLGIDPDDVEENLQKHFTLAAKWDCILLLDEADVFLQQRHQNQLTINAIVSVFLRQLEYYTGILFLTTNRVGDIDRAFKSRIHVTLEYKPLDRETTLEIYKLRINRVKAEYRARDRPLKVKEAEIIEWAKKHFKKSKAERRQWNGRQIFNAFQTAIALAEWSNSKTNEKPDKKAKKVTLGKEQFKQVAKVSAGFDQYMTDLLGYDEHYEAAKTMIRRDLQEDVAPPRTGARSALASSKATKHDSSDTDSDTASEKDESSDSDDSEAERKKKKKEKKWKKKEAKKTEKDSSDSDDGDSGS